MARIVQELKRDALGHVELVEVERQGATQLVVRRVAAARFGLGFVARVLAARERRALERLAEHGDAALRAGVGELVDDAALAALPDLHGRMPRAGEVVLRTYVRGEPLHRAEALPLNYFALLEELVCAMHAAGVCHNDLHKEQNVLVQADGRPALIDFQLASVHPRCDRRFVSRCHDDLRHVQKHRRRYTRDGRGPVELVVHQAERLPRTPIARIWRRTAKPLYNFITRRLLRTRDGEARRPSSGPWPRWTPPA
jgi:hypothetical protein